MEKEKLHYYVVSGETKSDFINNVNERLRAGWQLHGTAFFACGSFQQPVISLPNPRERQLLNDTSDAHRSIVE